MQTDIILLPINIQFDSIKRLAKCQCQTQFIHYVTYQLHLKHADWNVPTIVFKNILTAPLFPVVCVFNEHSLSHVQLHYSVFHILKANNSISPHSFTLLWMVDMRSYLCFFGIWRQPSKRHQFQVIADTSMLGRAGLLILQCLPLLILWNFNLSIQCHSIFTCSCPVSAGDFSSSFYMGEPDQLFTQG